MKVSEKPLLTITKAWFADSVRVVKGRVPGAFQSLRNLVSYLGDGIGRIRPGFVNYSAAQNGKNAPASTKILKIAGIQSPEQEDVHIYFVDTGAKTIQMNPYWRGATKIDGTAPEPFPNLTINESKSFTPAVDGNFPAANQMAILGSDALGLSSVADYYKGWIMKNTTQSEYAQISGYAYVSTAGGTSTFTFVEDVNAGGLNWDVVSPPGGRDSFVIYRHFHENPTFAPSFNDDLANPVALNVENSIIRLSGGQSSTNGNRGIHITPRLTRTFFPSNARAYTYDGTYASERECRAMAKADVLDTTSKITLTDNALASALPSGKTYWVAVAPVYDGWQIGAPVKFETFASDYTDSGSNWTENYLASGGGTITFPFYVSVAKLNKRITGFATCIADDDGDTRSIGRQSPYHIVNYTAITGTIAGLGFQVGLGVFNWSLGMFSANISGIDSTFLTGAGYSDSGVQIMGAYSTEEVVGTRRYIANIYRTADSSVDRQFVWTNAVGGSVLVGNAGVMQPDIFPDAEALYRLRLDPSVGTKINAIVPVDLEEFVVFKDRGVIKCRSVTVGNYPNLIQSVESRDVGMTTPNAWAKDDLQFIYFPSYQDIYRYRHGQIEALIERPDKNDWLATYRDSVSATEKENATVVYLPEWKAVVFCFGNNRAAVTGWNGMTYMYCSDGWRQVQFQEAVGVAGVSFRYYTSLRNGHILGITADTPSVRRFTWNWTGSAYTVTYLDGSTAIVPYFHTGDLFSGGESNDLIISKAVINKTLTGSNTTGTLDIYLRADGTANGWTGQDKTKTRLNLKHQPAAIRRANKWSLEYNANASPEILNAGSTFQIDSIELFGRQEGRRQRVGE